MGINIKNHWSGEVIYKSEKASLKEALIEALTKRADLYGANLSAVVLSVHDLDGNEIKDFKGTLYSKHDYNFEYVVGETTTPSNGFNPDLREECAPGIHFFITLEEAKEY